MVDVEHIQELSDDLLKLVLRHLDAGSRNKAACTCRRWERLIRGMQSTLVLRDAPPGGHCDASALFAALSQRPHVRCLRSSSSQGAGSELAAFVCGLLARQLECLHLRTPAALPPQSLPWLAGLPHLQDLVLEQYIATVPPSVSALRSLTRLVVVCRELEGTLPAHANLAGLTALRTLWLEDCFIAGSRADRLLGCPALQDLTLRACLLEAQVQPILAQLSQLTALDLAYSPVWEGSWQEQVVPAGVQVLNLTACALQQLPDSVAQLTSLQVLSVSRNGLEELPSGPYLSSLEALDLRWNEILPGWREAADASPRAAGVQPSVQLSSQPSVGQQAATAESWVGHAAPRLRVLMTDCPVGGQQDSWVYVRQSEGLQLAEAVEQPAADHQSDLSEVLELLKIALVDSRGRRDEELEELCLRLLCMQPLFRALPEWLRRAGGGWGAGRSELL